MICLCILASALFAGQVEELTEERRWQTPAELQVQLETHANTFDEVRISTIGVTAGGQPIQCLEVAREGEIAIADRGAILVVAGIDGNHLLGSAVATDLIENLLSRDPETTKDLLEVHKLFIIPQVNIDVAKEFFTPIPTERQKNYKPVDDDHDGFIDEDAPEDINGDGVITMMRVPDQEIATHLEDPDEARLHITPDALKGQSASFVLYTEGIDNDNDGKFNEDDIGGVDLNKNFMHGYKYHGDGAGSWQLSENESKALADFVFAHQEIAFILVYGRHDTLTKPLKETGKDKAGAPKTLDGGDVELYKQVSESFNACTALQNTEQPSWDGSFVAWAYTQYGVPAFSTPLWARPEPIKENEEEGSSTDEAREGETNQDENLQSRGDRGGMDRESMRGEFDVNGDGELDEDERSSMREAMRERFGDRPRGGRGGEHRTPRSASNAKEDADSLSDNLTPSSVGDISQETLDELMQAAQDAGYPVNDEMAAEITPEQVEQYAKMMGIVVRRVQKNTAKNKTASGDVAWLAYSDDQRGGEGFVEWTTFEHPQLGTVEIGGWVPYFKSVPPSSVIEQCVSEQATFLLDIASKLPDVHLGEAKVTQLGTTLWEVKVPVINDGWFPSGTSMAKRNKRARPYVVRLNVENNTIISGQKVQRIWALDGGGTQKWFTWVIQAKPNSDVYITLYSEKFGSESIAVPMKSTSGEAK